MNEGLFTATKKFTDAFFDGLKTNATNKALAAAKKNKSIIFFGKKEKRGNRGKKITSRRTKVTTKRIK